MKSLVMLSVLAAGLVCVAGLALDLCMLCGSDTVCKSSCELFAGKRDALVGKRQLDLCILCGSDMVCKSTCQLIAGKRDAQLYRRQLCQDCNTSEIGCRGVCTNLGEVTAKRDCSICGDNLRCALVCNVI